MTFRELISGLNYDDIWAVLDKEYKNKDGAYEVYKRVFEELKSLDPKPCEPLITLVVAKVEDCFEAGTFIFDVFGIQDRDEEHYALEMTSWIEWLSFEVLDKSIEAYGAANVVAHALYEMTFFGYSSDVVDERVTEEKQILHERHEEIENGTAELISFDEFMAELGYVDERTEEEKEQQQKKYLRITAENKKVYKMLLGR